MSDGRSGVILVTACLCTMLGLGVAESSLAAEYSRVEIQPPTNALSGIPGMFGVGVKVLPNGNVVVADPWYSLDPVDNTRIGIVALYRPDGTLISLLRGTHAGDRISSIGDDIAFANVTVLANGNFVVGSSLWHEGRGAVTWGDATIGWGEGNVVEISAENSLVGSTPGSRVGSNVIALTNGHFVAASPSWDSGALIDVGAVTWADGEGGTVGVVSAENSLVGSHSFDYVGAKAVVALTNGNYVVSSTLWDDGDRLNAGAATWCPGIQGCSGAVDVNASLKGRHANDLAGFDIIPFPNGNYVVVTPNWHDDGDIPVGAATFRNGSTGEPAYISPENSLYGSSIGDFQGTNGGVSVLPLTDGNWVLAAPGWDAPAQEDVGAVAWMKAETGGIGPISPANALTGTRMSDGDLLWTVALTNGNYVAGFPFWDNNSGIVNVVNAGAVVWGHGDAGVSGPIDANENALVGISADDRVGWGRATALANGDYVVSSPWWDLIGEEDVRTDVGAVTWRSGSEPSTGVILPQNSLIGSSNGDFVDRVIALSNGNYVVLAPSWDQDTIANVGAATWCPGSGCAGPILMENSLTGSFQDDAVGTGGFALAHGDYVILSWQWSENKGAVTWRPGDKTAPGQVTPQNSLIGTTPFDALGFGFNHYGAFLDGSYLIQSRQWDVPHTDAGAVVLAHGDGRTVGPLSLDREDLLAGHAPDSAFYTVWHYGEESRLLAVGEYISNLVTLLQREDDLLFRDGFEMP